jgi:transposase-like protein
MTRHPATQDALVEELRKGSTAPKAMLGAHGLLQHRTQRVSARALEAELTTPLGEAPPARHGTATAPDRQGQGKHTVHPATAPCARAGPRDRAGRCEPPWVPKRQRRLAGGADQGLARSARGLSTRASPAQLEDLEEGAGAPTRLANSTAAGLDAVRAWPARPLASVSPLLDWAALWVQARHAGPGPTTAVAGARGSPSEGETARWG